MSDDAWDTTPSDTNPEGVGCGGEDGNPNVVQLGDLQKMRQFLAAKEAAESSNDARSWSPEEALRYTLSRIESGDLNPSKILIMYNEDIDDPDIDESYQPGALGFTSAGVIAADLMAMLVATQNLVVRLWLYGDE